MRLSALLALCATFGSLPQLCAAQSADLLRAMQGFEAAKTDNKSVEAKRLGAEAVRLAASDADEENFIGVLRNVGDYSAQSGDVPLAIDYYKRALAAKEVKGGREQPDLAPLLEQLAALQMRAKRYLEAEETLNRAVGINRDTYGAHHENTLAALRALKQVYLAMQDSAGVARVDAQLKPPPPPTRGIPKPGDRSFAMQNGFATVRVFYGTNRAASGESKPSTFYGPSRGELQYGYLDVTIPEVHKEAELETQPRWMEITFAANQAAMRTRYVLLESITPLPKEQFAAALHKQVASSPSHDVYVFVHGFNNTFEDAARRAAQLAFDLDFDGTPMLYSWPSQGSTSAYAIDEAAVQISGRKMADFLETVVAQSGAQRIHLIAHSMGNRALIEALQTYLARRAPEKREHIFGQIVFTAPDVDRDYFTDAVQSLQGAAERTTLYASNNDYALRSSQFFHGAPRAGTAGDVIVKLAGLDSIDMSAVPADSLGHSYFAANSGAIYDIFRLLWRGDPPPQRCGMSSRASVWLFNADLCKGDDVLEAGVMLKRFGDTARAKVLANLATLTDPSQQQEWSAILKRLDLLLPAPNSGRGNTP